MMEFLAPRICKKKNSVGNQGKDGVQFLCLNLSLIFLVIVVMEPALFGEKSLEVRIPSQEHGRYTLVEQVCSSFIPSPNSVFVPDFCLIPIRGNKNCHLSFLSSFLASSILLPLGISYRNYSRLLLPLPPSSAPVCQIQFVYIFNFCG